MTPKQAPPSVAVHYVVIYDDGTALHASGEHADVIYRYVQECEQLCTTKGLAYYEGPPMERLPKAQLLERLQK